MMNCDPGMIVFPLFIQGNTDNETLMLLAVNILKQLIGLSVSRCFHDHILSFFLSTHLSCERSAFYVEHKGWGEGVNTEMEIVLTERDFM